MRSSTRAKLSCPSCGRTFSKAEHRDRHIRSHTKEKPFQCFVCNKSYSRSDTLLRHRREHDAFKTPNPNALPVQGPSIRVEHQYVAPAVPTWTANLFAEQESTEAAIAGSQASSSSSFNNSVPALNLIERETSNPSNPYQQTQDEAYQFLPWEGQDDFLFGIQDIPVPGFMSSFDASLFTQFMKPTASSTHQTASPNIPWYTKLSKPDKSPTLVDNRPAPETRTEIDDSYRQYLRERLSLQPQSQAIPSSVHLNTCLRLYFLRFHPLLPIVHPPSFRPSTTNTALLLSICTIGCLFTGSTDAYKLSSQLFESLQKASLAKWEDVMAGDPEEAITLLESGILGQTFGLLSGDPKHLAQIDALHGLVVSWARRCNLFRARHKRVDLSSLTPPELENAWDTWVKTERNIRMCTALYVHDAEIAQLFHHEPLLHYGKKWLPAPAPEAVFMASTVDEWKVQYTRNLASNGAEHQCFEMAADSGSLDLRAHNASNLFAAYQFLVELLAALLEAKVGKQFEGRFIAKVTRHLMAFYEHFLADRRAVTADVFDLRILWHLAFINLFADCDMLERAVGREGPPDQQIQNSVIQWASSACATRCAIHAAMVIQEIEQKPMGHELALHTSRAIFFSGLVWYCYGRFARFSSSTMMQEAVTEEFPELQLIDLDIRLLHVFFKTQGSKHDFSNRYSAVYVASDLLQRIGHWEISRRMSTILSGMVCNSFV